MEAVSNARRNYLWPILLVLAGSIVGAAMGWDEGVHELQSIADAHSQQGKSFCGTGIIFLPFFLAFVGASAGAVPGMAVAAFVYFKTARHRPRAQSDWAAYYGR